MTLDRNYSPANVTFNLVIKLSSNLFLKPLTLTEYNKLIILDLMVIFIVFNIFGSKVNFIAVELK